MRSTEHYITLRKFEIDVTIEARYENLPLAQARITDGDGNDLVEMELVMNLTYPSHCGTDIEMAIAQANFILECCNAARGIRECFSKMKVYEMLISAAEELERQQKDNESIVVRAVICNCKGLRAKQNKNFGDGTFSDKLVPGNYSIKVDKKTYEVTVDALKYVSVTRMT